MPQLKWQLNAGARGQTQAWSDRMAYGDLAKFRAAQGVAFGAESDLNDLGEDHTKTEKFLSSYFGRTVSLVRIQETENKVKGHKVWLFEFN